MTNGQLLTTGDPPPSPRSRLPIVLAASALLACGTGCSAMSAILNPKVAFALQEPAPMALVLRRADAARVTATNVDRLLGSTPGDATSTWIPKLGLKKADADASLHDIGGDPDYALPPGNGAKLRVVQAEAWAQAFSAICPHESKFPNLIAQLTPDLAASFADIEGQAKAVAKLKADKATEETALDDKDISSADRETHEKKKKDIEDEMAKLETEYRPKVDTFLGKLRDGAASASPEAKKQIPVALVALKRAVDDAKLANAVALVRYPMAMPGMPTELKSQAKRIVADVVEDRTGHRPNLDKFEPDVKLTGGSVAFTLNGLPPDALAGLSPADLLKGVTTRAKDYVLRVLTFTAYVAETADLLELEGNVVRTAMDGLTVDEGKVDGAGDDLADVQVEMDGSSAAKGAKGAKGGNTRHPVPLVACGVDQSVVKVDDKGKAGKTGGAPRPTRPAGSPGPAPAVKKKPEILVD